MPTAEPSRERGPAVFVHTADPHLDFKNKQIQRQNEAGRNIREYDFFAAFTRLVMDVLAMAVPPRAFVIAGDLFDTPRPGQVVVKGVVALFNLLEAAGIETIVIAGNHDTPQMRTTTSAFETLMEIEYRHIHFAYDDVRRLVIEDTEFVMVPHIPLASGLDAETVRPDRSAAEYSVLVIHGVAAGNELFKQLDEQRELPISEYLLTLGHDYVALGHHHRRTMPMPGVWYPGSLENTSFGKDASSVRGALLVDLAAVVADPAGYRPPLHQVPVRPLVEPHPVEAEGLDARSVETAIQHALAPFDLQDALVRVLVRGLTKDVRSALDKGLLKSLGTEAFYFKIDWKLKQVVTQMESSGSEGIRPLDEEYKDAVEAYYRARDANTLPPKDEVRDSGVAYLRTAMEVETDD